MYLSFTFVKFIILVILFKLVASIPFSADASYGLFHPTKDLKFCETTCTDKQKHVACNKNCNKFAKNGCKPFLAQHMISLRMLMLTDLNAVRSKLANTSSISNMQAVNYSLGLEYLSRCTAVKCNNEPDSCAILRDIPIVRQLIHQHVFKNIVDVHMIDVVKDALKFWEKTVGEKDKLLWVAMGFIGCSVYYLEPKTSEDYHADVTIVCNIGSVADVKAASGTVCSACNMTACNKEYTGLCGEIAAVPVAVQYSINCCSAMVYISWWEIIVMNIVTGLIKI